MKKLKVLIPMLVVFWAFIVIAEANQKSGVRKDPPPLLYRLSKKDHKILIKKGLRGHLYHVTSPEGVVVANDLTEAELKTRKPEVYELVMSAVAALRRSSLVMEAGVGAIH